MRYLALIVFVGLTLNSCHQRNNQLSYFDYQNISNSKIPDKIPMPFMENLITENQLIHRGIFSPDFKHFYFTISNKDYSNFTVKSIHKIKNKWSEPEIAFFNSSDDDHGMSFAPDGNSIYFSSTRKVDNDRIPNTWHLWKTTKINGEWTQAQFIDIPNLRQKLVSHPTITNSGRLYFHVSDPDYSNMNLFYADQINGEFQNANLVFSKQLDHSNEHKCTPFISPDDQYIIYAKIEAQLKLMICYKDTNQNWTRPIELNEMINKNGQGNPFVTSDGKFLFYATGNHKLNNWKLKWVNMDNIEKNGD